MDAEHDHVCAGRPVKSNSHVFFFFLPGQLIRVGASRPDGGGGDSEDYGREIAS